MVVQEGLMYKVVTLIHLINNTMYMLAQARVIDRPNLKAVHRSNECTANRLNLTRREREVLEYICLGYTMKDTAKALFLSVSTVISHKRKLLSKFNVNNLVRLAVLAERYSLTIG